MGFGLSHEREISENLDLGRLFFSKLRLFGTLIVLNSSYLDIF